MMEFAAIIPDHGGRERLIELCRLQLNRMTVKPSKYYFVDFPSTFTPDLTERIEEGILKARADGFKFAFIIEDDFYPADYFERMAPTENDYFIGDDKTTCYHLGNKTWETYSHPGRSSLFCTGINLETFDFDFETVYPRTAYLDYWLWDHAHRTEKKIRFVDTKTVSIKHGIGICGGGAHTRIMANSDPDGEWLKANIDEEAYGFYKTLKL